MSHDSPADTMPSPHDAGQSLSVPMFAPAGQHPSPFAGVVIAGNEQVAAHDPAPVSTSLVHAMPSLQVVGQRPGMPAGIVVSHASPASTTPFPQVAVQSESVVMVAPAGQQPSPFAGAVIAVDVH